MNMLSISSNFQRRFVVPIVIATGVCILFYYTETPYVKEAAQRNKPVPKMIPEDDFMPREDEIELDKYEKRKQHIEMLCKKYKENEIELSRSLVLEKRPGDFLPYINTGSKILWAEIPKVASSTMKAHFLKLRSSSNKHKDIDIKKKMLHSSIFLLNTWNKLVREEGYTSLVFVRHPFTRILSAYRSKLENSSSQGYFFYKGLSMEIAERYRPPKLKETLHRESCTFAEFIDAVLNGNRDRHWVPISDLAYPCDLEYTLVGKMETIESDMDEFRGRMLPVQLDRDVWKNRRDSSQIVNQYFSTIDNKTLHLLYEQYKRDFELFDYDYRPYLSMVQP